MTLERCKRKDNCRSRNARNKYLVAKVGFGSSRDVSFVCYLESGVRSELVEAEVFLIIAGVLDNMEKGVYLEPPPAGPPPPLRNSQHFSNRETRRVKTQSKASKIE